MTAPSSVRQDSTLSQLLREVSLAQPERIAVISGQRQLTFEQFNDQCEQVAEHLLGAGVHANQPVGIFLDPSIDLVISVWGALHAGAAYLPLSPEYPDERLRYMITDAQVSTVLTSPDLAARLARLVPPQTTVLMAAQVPEAGSPVNRAVQQPHNLAYLIYTSGSTGNPKGIGIEQHSIVNQMRWLTEHQGLVPGQVVLQKTPFSFDAAQWEILAPACGSTVVMSELGAYGDPNRLLELIRAHDVTVLQGVPTLWQALVDSDELSTCGSLERIFSGGEALPKSLAIELLEALPQVELVNLYGPSECTINTSSYVVGRDSVAAGPDVIPIGRPVDGMRLYVLDVDHNLVEPGESGELYISGVQVARGYLNRPDLTSERFLENPFSDDACFDRLYRSGDLARQNDDGTLQFLGRTDSQVKLRGFRVELDEVKVAIESHDWVKRAAVLVRDDPRTGANLVAFVELDPRQAALMDQGNHGRHHQSKQSRVQLAAQLSNAGVRHAPGQPRIELAGREASSRQRRSVFARKTYRFFDGDELDRNDLLQLLDLLGTRPSPPLASRRLESLSASEFGELLRYFGQFLSSERLLPKYGYASPGSLYATQLYLALSGVAGIPPGHYYYHPIEHRLVLIAKLAAAHDEPRLVTHFMGRRSAIEAVYRNNIQEVLQFEAGHMVGLFDEVLPDYGLQIDRGVSLPAPIATLDCALDDYYLASFEISPAESADADSGAGQSDVEVYLQAHPGRVRGLSAGLYRYADGQFQPVGDEVVLKRQVIAINQEVYERSSFGLSLISRAPDPWQRYVDLGRAMHRLQRNHLSVGLMSAGYSSQTGNDLPAARRIAAILGLDHKAASYFAVGGPITEEQQVSEGMREDSVHMRGPMEIIKDDLVERLPRYMVPNRVILLDKLPVTVNGKIDSRALETFDEVSAEHPDVPTVAPRTAVEKTIASIWQDTLQSELVSIHEDFFAAGGHSLTAVGLIRRINLEFGSALPLQVLFEAPTIAQLAGRIERDTSIVTSRLVRLDGGASRTGSGPLSSSGSPIFCWPGLGGYPMSLRLMASRLPAKRPFYGVQAHGINPGEIPYATLGEMADADIELIRAIQPTGPYTLWGYSFGARLAFEVAYRLERAGARVDSVVLIAPGKPPVASAPSEVVVPRFTSRTFVSILYSVFAGNLDRAGLDECLATATDERSFVDFIWRRFEHLDEDLVRRLVGVVRQTFEFEYAVKDLVERQLSAPITVFTAHGDQSSFVDALAEASAAVPNLTRVPLHGDHYGLLRAEGVEELINAIEINRSDSQFTHQRITTVPHISIKHFPHSLDAAQTADLVAAITSAVRTAFACDEGAVSIALEPVAEHAWNEQVYVPEITDKRATLVKVPNY